MLGIIKADGYLEPYSAIIEKRHKNYLLVKDRIAGYKALSEYACGHFYYGVQKKGKNIIFREWAPNASEIYLISELSNWKPDPSYKFEKIPGTEDWKFISTDNVIKDKMLYKLYIKWPGGEGERLPAYAKRVVQDDVTKIFSAQIWFPKKEYKWRNPAPLISKENAGKPLMIYEAHIGMAQEEAKVGTFAEFEEKILPIVKKSGYNAIQFMALMEHPYYGSFGYQISNFFALSSRFGTPEEFKSLVDACHGEGIKVFMDIVHSHAVKNENEGLSKLDGTNYLYFHAGAKGNHPAWDSKLFNYAKDGVLHFLLSNCAFWLTEYCLDGFRFDGVTSMLYKDHGLERNFVSYDDYFSENFDDDAAIYLTLANTLIHELKPGAVTISEDMSGYPGVAAGIADGGLGFDYRLAMGIPDFWIKIIKEKRDEEWSVGEIWHQLNNRRWNEKSIAYCESHDQALVGDKTIAFRLMDAHMYHAMNVDSQNMVVDRGVALHKIIRLLTFAAGGEGYLNFMGNEFGHPEWIDFPREGNNWSYNYARRQWPLFENRALRYCHMGDFDRAMVENCAEAMLAGFAAPIRIDEPGQVIAFRRGDLLFAVNLNPFVSHVDYELDVDRGIYKLVLNSDSDLFGGFSRVPDSLVLDSFTRGNRNIITPYIPSRSALVFKDIKQEKKA
ncbi:MAG: alpha amylase C-terminal domain-containing protein [Spirochaetes bacterium]|nr:alpha amylase C-terminal domain-containing protein [Spirochaetota bacterium]